MYSDNWAKAQVFQSLRFSPNSTRPKLAFSFKNKMKGKEKQNENTKK